jgi:hypothetical protein
MNVVHEPTEDALSALGFRDLRLLTWASIVTLVCICIVFWSWTSSGQRLLYLLALLPVLLPYAFIPLRIRSQRLRSGLTLSLAMSSALFIPGIYLLRFALTWDKRWWIVGSFVTALLMQAVLAVNAANSLLSMPSVPRGRVTLLGSFAYGFLLFGLFWSFYSSIPAYIRSNEHFAMKYLTDCAVSAFLEAHEHGGLYPSDFASLASSPMPSCMATGPWAVNPANPSNGYVFQYSGTGLPATIGPCTRFKGFVMTARPVVFGRTGIRSFLIDERMSVHATSENRPANGTDPIDRTILPEHRPQ